MKGDEAFSQSNSTPSRMQNCQANRAGDILVTFHLEDCNIGQRVCPDHISTLEGCENVLWVWKRNLEESLREHAYRLQTSKGIGTWQ